MPKKRKNRKSERKILEEPKKKNSNAQTANSTANSKENDLMHQIKKVAEGLYYVSETDAEIEPFAGKPAAVVAKEEVLTQSGNAADSPVEERDYTQFFARLTEIQDWFGDEEKETAQKFVQLRELLEKNLKDLKVFRIGKIQLDVYVVGLDAEGNLAGIKTKAVET